MTRDSRSPRPRSLNPALSRDNLQADLAAACDFQSQFDPTAFRRWLFSELSDGRDHNPWGFTMWMAGGGAKPEQYFGSTDEIGLRAQEKPVHVHDIHATILWMLGLDHLKTTYMHNGRAERPTVLAGEVIKEIYT